MEYYIGWDVGAWHCSPTGAGSKDAIAIVDSHQSLIGTWKGNLSEHILDTAADEEPLTFFLKGLFERCLIADRYSFDAFFWLAVDTPLGWPLAFRQLLNCMNRDKACSAEPTVQTSRPLVDGETLINLKRRKIENRLLHRATERAIGQSLSAVQDQIGSQSTKAMYLLEHLNINRDETGVWGENTPNVTLIETYPAPCLRSFSFIDRMKSIRSTNRVDSVDVFDAIACAAVAHDFATNCTNLLDEPDDKCDADEGWIFAPKCRMTASSRISYGRLIESQTPVKSLAELLSQIQIGMILKHTCGKKVPATDNAIVDGWLKDSATLDSFAQKTTLGDIRALFKLLHPKAAPKQFPSEAVLAEVVKRVRRQGEESQ